MYCVSLDLPNGTCHSRLTLKKEEEEEEERNEKLTTVKLQAKQIGT